MTLKKEAEEEDDEIRGRKGGKVKKKKERSIAREERPLARGAHGLARQDGLDLPLTNVTLSDLLEENQEILKLSQDPRKIQALDIEAQSCPILTSSGLLHPRPNMRPS